jgi:hypothetical protein
MGSLNYFRIFKGLRQGDPLSAFLFNLVADTLATLLTRARDASFIRGIGTELVEGVDSLTLCRCYSYLFGG